MKIVFATSNKNKIKEVQKLLPNSIEIIGLEEINCNEDIPETSSTIEGNAIQKANYVLEHYKVPCFADDTGLEVKSLNGAPGVLSARYAGNDKNNEKNIEKLLTELEGVTDRAAQFKTVIAISGIEQETITLEGICKGAIISEKKGNNGFGYDPVFLPQGYDETFAEMNLEEKNTISHRAIAVKKLITFLKSR